MGTKSRRTLKKAYNRGYKEFFDHKSTLDGRYYKAGKAFLAYITGCYNAKNDIIAAGIDKEYEGKETENGRT